MNCPKCNAVIPEGCLLCESCGSEIQIVPDFDPAVELQINETLSDVKHDIFGTTVEMKVPEQMLPGEEVPEDKPVFKEEDSFDDNPFNEDESSERTRRKLGVVLLAISVLLCILCGVAFVLTNHSSVSYLVRKAVSCADEGAYQEAISYVSKAREKQPFDPELTFLEAGYYEKSDQTEVAINMYQDMIASEEYDDNQKFIAYDKLIKLYKDGEQYQDINALLLACKYDSIISTYKNYLANKPEFSVQPGIYDEVLSLKINSNTSGKIYYTVDGSEPSEQSQVYSGPITLESGKYVIKAMFINIYGIRSDVETKEYYITLTRPAQPVVSLESGEYNQAAMISVTCESGCRIYYTTDDSVPTIDSVPYTGAIPMPLGTTNFQFIAVNNDGISSEPLVKSYNLVLENSISTSTAVRLLVDALIEKGILLDRNGHKAGTNGTYNYEFSSVIHATDGNDYYTINEVYDDGTGIPVRTDVVYLTGVYTGEVFRLGFNDVGRFAAIPF